jgi:transforming growth factor-beta-induced protein
MKTTLNLSRGIRMLAFVMGIMVSASVIASGPASAKKNIVEVAIADERFSILVEAVVKAELVDALSAEGPYTVFAPTDDAFKALFKELGVSGIVDLSKDQLTPILLYHVVSGKVMAKDVKSGTVPTLNDKASLEVEASKKGVMINGSSQVIITDVAASNGVIHVIDKVLVPNTKTASKSSGGCN